MTNQVINVNIDANQKLKEIGEELLDLYIQYFGNLFTTFQEDQESRRKRNALITQFVSACFNHIQKDIFKSVYFKFNVFFQKNSSDDYLKESIETAFHNAILEVANKIFLQALFILYSREELDKEEVVSIVNNTFQDFLYNYKAKSNKDFLAKTIEKISKSFDSNTQPKEDFTSNFKGLIYTIVNNRIIDVQRKLSKDLRHELAIDQAGQLSGNTPGADELLSSQEAIDEKWHIFYQLKREEQIFMLLRYRYQSPEGKTGMPFSEIAQIYDSTESTMKVKRNRILKKLSKPSAANAEKEEEVDYKKYQDKITEEQNAVLKKIIIAEENPKAKNVFELAFKNFKSYWLMLRWIWIFDPTVFTLADIYDINKSEEVKRIAGVHKTVLWDSLINEKIIQ